MSRHMRCLHVHALLKTVASPGIYIKHEHERVSARQQQICMSLCVKNAYTRECMCMCEAHICHHVCACVYVLKWDEEEKKKHDINFHTVYITCMSVWLCLCVALLCVYACARVRAKLCLFVGTMCLYMWANRTFMNVCTCACEDNVCFPIMHSLMVAVPWLHMRITYPTSCACCVSLCVYCFVRTCYMVCLLRPCVCLR